MNKNSYPENPNKTTIHNSKVDHRVKTFLCIRYKYKFISSKIVLSDIDDIDF